MNGLYWIPAFAGMTIASFWSIAFVQIRHAVILAGGMGTRLGIIGRHIPKLLLPIAGETIFDRQLRQLAQWGIRSVTVVVSRRYRSLLCREPHFFDKKTTQSKVDIHLTYEWFPKGPTAALLKLTKTMTHPTLFLLGDIVYTHPLVQPIPTVSATHPVLLFLSRHPRVMIPDGCAVTVDRNGQATAIREKPALRTLKGNWVWNGAFMLHPSFNQAVDILKLSPLQTNTLLLGTLFDQLRQSGIPIMTHAMPGRHININTLSDLVLAEKWSHRQPKETA